MSALVDGGGTAVLGLQCHFYISGHKVAVLMLLTKYVICIITEVISTLKAASSGRLRNCRSQDFVIYLCMRPLSSCMRNVCVKCCIIHVDRAFSVSGALDSILLIVPETTEYSLCALIYTGNRINDGQQDFSMCCAGF